MLANTKKWMIYGANGYTGRLIASRAFAQGETPVLAGREASKVEAVAREWGGSHRVFPLSTGEEIAKNLEGMSAVLHCAGPFSKTAKPMMNACLLAGVNYLDITGEVEIIEHAAQQDERTRSAGISMMPAVGFDVVPSDCLAARLAAALPTATQLELAFQAGTSLSPGTANTMLAHLGEGGRVRKEGHIVRVPVAWKTTKIKFPSGERSATTIPWGDVSSAFYTTGIPNIEVYTAMPEQQSRALRRWGWLAPAMKFAPIQWLGRQWIKRFVQGPGESLLAKGRAEFWGRATDKEGRSAEATLVTPQGYSLTAHTAVEIMKRTLAGDVPPGFSTPGKVFGGEFIERFDNVVFKWGKGACG